MTSNYIMCFDERDEPYLAHANEKVWKTHKYLMKVPNALGPGKDLYLYTQKEIDAWNKNKRRTISNRIKDRLGWDERDKVADLSNNHHGNRLSRTNQMELRKAQEEYNKTALGRFENAKTVVSKYKETTLSDVRNSIGKVKNMVEGIKESANERKEAREQKKLSAQNEKQVADTAKSLERQANTAASWRKVSVTDVYRKRIEENENLLRSATSEEEQQRLRRDRELLELGYARSMSKYTGDGVQSMVKYLSADKDGLNNNVGVKKSYNALKKQLNTQISNASNKELKARYQKQLQNLENAYAALNEIYLTDGAEPKPRDNIYDVYMSFYHMN